MHHEPELGIVTIPLVCRVCVVIDNKIFAIQIEMFNIDMNVVLHASYCHYS